MLSAQAGFVSDFSYLRGIVSDFPYLRGLTPAKHHSGFPGFVSDFSYLRGIVSDFPYLRGCPQRPSLASFTAGCQKKYYKWSFGGLGL